ncbi:MAG: immunoglobulin domain-containing protein [Verrucomicrobiota bacterium]
MPSFPACNFPPRSVPNTVPGTNPPAGDCVAVPSGAISWWRAEGNSADSTSSNHGTLTGSVNYTAGRIGQAFSFDGNRAGVSAGKAANLQLQNFSVEAWIKRSSDSVISFNGNGNGQLFSVGAGGGGLTFYLQADSRLALGKLQVNVVTSDAMVTDTNWHHVAVTKQSTNVCFFVDGAAYAAPAYDSGGFTFDGPAYIGAWLNPSQLVDNSFYGTIDEMTVYNRALTTNEIAALSNASVDGKCVPAITPPIITQQPQDTLVIAGGTAQFDVVATGIPTPSYQWYFNDDQLAGQTNATLILSNVLPDKDGTYSVRVFNPSGSILSSNANLSVVTTQAVLLVDGNTSGFYNEALGTILDGTTPQFPLPFDQGGDDPTLFPAPEPNLAAGAGILGDWLTAPANLNSNWHPVAVVPTTWALNTETAIIYPVDGGSRGVINLRGDFDADNGIYVWVNGQFRFGARAPGLPSPLGLFEYTNVFLGDLAPGSNYLQILREDSGISVGYQIRLTGTALSTNRLPPVIVQSPTNQSVAAGGSVLFAVVAEGTPELAYQWRFAGADLAGQTGNSLSLLSVQPTNAGDYSVLVSNAYGAVTSSIATLTVLTYPPVITSQPPDRTVFEGKPATLSVTATGTAPLRYYWSHNETNSLSATTSTLTLSSVQANQAGIYQVIVSNNYGQATSRLAQLTVVPPPPCAPAPEGVIAWWPGQSNLWDVVGGFDATLSPSQSPPTYLLYTTGKVDAALNLGVTSSYGVVLTGGKLNVNTNTGLTIEGWIRPTTLSVGPLVEWNDGRSAPGAGLLINSTGPGVIEATLTDTNATTRTVTLRSAPYAVTNGLWQHVAFTYDKIGGWATIYVNGNLVAQTNVGVMTPNTSGDVYLGYRRFGSYSGARFNGVLDEITLYNRALAGTELQAIIASDVTGKCPPPPPPCVPPPADIAAWWRGESNTVDMVAGNDAVRIPTNYPTVLSYQAGQFGAAFRFSGANFLSVPRSEGLDVGPGNGLTVEGWIYPATLSAMPIVEWTDTNSYGANLWMSFSRGPTVLEANLIDTAGGFHLIRSPVNTIRGYSWQHVAVTYDKTTGLAALYSDGNLVISTNLGFFTPRTSTELLIGSIRIARFRAEMARRQLRITGLMERLMNWPSTAAR